MEHSLAQVRSPWRTATLVASALAAVELVALVALGAVLLAKPVSEHVRQAAEAQVLAPVTPKPSRAQKRSPLRFGPRPRLATGRAARFVSTCRASRWLA